MIEFAKLGRRKQFLLAYVLLLFFSGIWQNPLFACIISAVYLLGLAGLVTVYDARKKASRSNQYMYSFLGCLLIFISVVWLEILVIIMPFMSAY
jgi:hypothetical protein